MITYFERLYTAVPEIVEAEAPVSISEIALIKDTVDNEILLRITLANGSEESVKAVAVDIKAWDVFGDPVLFDGNDTKTYVYQDISFQPMTLYGNTVPIAMPESVRKVEAVITRAVFDNGSVWKSNPVNFVHVQKQDLFEGTDEFIAGLATEGEKYPPFLAYTENGECWQCTCGAVNRIATISCHRCGRSQTDCKREYSAEAVHVKFEDYKAEKVRIAEEKRQEEEAEKERKRRQREIQIKKEQEERRKRQEELEKVRKEEEAKRLEQECIRKQQNKKTITRIIAAIIAIGVVCCFVFVINPLLKLNAKYRHAAELFSSGEYAEAYNAYHSLGEYRDSENLSKKSKYNLALEYLDEGSYWPCQNAYELFTELKDYEDSEQLRIQSKYQMASISFQSKDYQSAYNDYMAIPDYEDSREKATISAYLFGKELYTNGKNREAADMFRKTIGYEDSERLCYEATYQAVKLDDHLLFGRYEQDKENEPIEWIIVGKKDQRLLLITKEPYGSMIFGKTGNFSYTESIVRNWCNEFYELCFATSEKKHILKTKISEDVEDYVTIPTKKQIVDIDDKDIDLKTTSTNTCWTRTEYKKNENNDNRYSSGWYVYFISSDGEISKYPGIYRMKRSVRPMILVDCSSNVEISKDITPDTVIRIVDEDVVKETKETEKKVQSSSSSSSTRKSSGSSSKTYSGSSSSSSSSSGYGYDANDPYYSAADHDGDGKLTDDEFQEAMGNAIDDLLAGTYQGG